MIVAEPFQAQPKLLHQSGAEVLHQHVAGRDKVADGRHALGRLQVQHHGALVAVQREEVGGVLAGERGPPVTRVVARFGALHLDDVGAQVAQGHGGERPRQHAREVQHAHAAQR